MQPNRPQPFRLPQRFDSPTLAKLAIPGEPTVIVRAVGVGSTAPFEYSDRNGRQAIFRYEREYDAHVLKVPASVWNANKGFMAHELMDQRRLPHPLVVTVEVPTAEATSPIKGLIDALKADPEYAWSWHCNLVMAMEDVGARTLQDCNKGAALFMSRLTNGAVDTTQHPDIKAAVSELLSKSQDGQEAKSSGPYPENAGASPAPATTSPEMDAPGNSEEASDVVVGQVSEQPGASSTFSGPGLTGDEEVTDESIKDFSSFQAPGKNEPAGDDALPFLAGSAWTLCEKPQRLKDLAGALNTDAETLKSAILHPLSAVELGHAGWVKRREPQA